MSGLAAARARTIAAGAGPDARPREDQLAGARPVWVDGMTLRVVIRRHRARDEEDEDE